MGARGRHLARQKGSGKKLGKEMQGEKRKNLSSKRVKRRGENKCRGQIALYAQWGKGKQKERQKGEKKEAWNQGRFLTKKLIILQLTGGGRGGTLLKGEGGSFKKKT